jgi:hypothetical protein
MTLPGILKQRVTVADGVLVRDLAGESVLLNLGTESYFGLDEVGTRMWSALTRAPSIDSALEELLGEYEADPVQLRDDLLVFVDRLAEARLVDIAGV